MTYAVDGALQLTEFCLTLQTAGQLQLQMLVELVEKYPAHPPGKKPPLSFQGVAVGVEMLLDKLEGRAEKPVREGIKLTGLQGEGKLSPDKIFHKRVPGPPVGGYYQMFSQIVSNLGQVATIVREGAPLG